MSLAVPNPLSTKTCKRGHVHAKSDWRCLECHKMRRKKNRCIDCGVPTSGLRCRVHTNRAIAERSAATIRKNWAEFIKNGRQGKRGKNNSFNPHWVGSRIIGNGYVFFTVNGKKVSEHRLVMEKMIGRKLLSSEQVHHRDGNKQNNSPENLELRTGAHGKGATKHCPTCTCMAHVSVSIGE